jgi:hypothetical protein
MRNVFGQLVPIPPAQRAPGRPPGSGKQAQGQKSARSAAAATIADAGTPKKTAAAAAAAPRSPASPNALAGSTLPERKRSKADKAPKSRWRPAWLLVHTWAKHLVIEGVERVGCTDCEAAGIPISLEPALDTLNKHAGGKKHGDAVAQRKVRVEQQAGQAQDE